MYKTYQLALITDNGIASSYSYGIHSEDNPEAIKDFWDELYSIDSREELSQFLEKFENESGGKMEIEGNRPDGVTLFVGFPKKIGYTFDGYWSADFVLVKNISGADKEISFPKNKYFNLETDERAVINLDEIYAASDEDITKRVMLDKLDEFKENLSGDMNRNYSDLWNLCADYDNEQNDGLYLTDRLQEAEFVDDDLLGEYMRSMDITDVDRLRCFIGDTYSDYIYRFDGYGNLANVDADDFENVVDDLQYELRGAITPAMKSRQAEM